MNRDVSERFLDNSSAKVKVFTKVEMCLAPSVKKNPPAQQGEIPLPKLRLSKRQQSQRNRKSQCAQENEKKTKKRIGGAQKMLTKITRAIANGPNG